MDTDAQPPRQPRRARGLALAALASIGALAIFLLMGQDARHAPSPGDAAPEARAASSAPESATAPAAASVAARAQPDDEVHDAPPPPLDLPPLLEALRQRAEAGDGEAAWELATLLRRCRSPRGADEIREMLIFQEARRRESGLVPIPEREVAAFIDRLVAEQAACTAVGPLPEDWAALDRTRWWAHGVAAEAGQREAQATFAARVHEEFNAPRRLLAEPARAGALHARARTYLDASLEAGEPKALIAAAQAAATGTFAAPDRQEARAWMLACFDVEGCASLPAVLVAERRAGVLEGMSDEDAAAIERRARELASTRRFGP